MWTLGYDDNGGEFSFSEPFDGARKLRPLVPRPMPSLRVNGSNFCAQYYHLASLLNEQSKREMNDTPPVVVSSSRWNPTPEQLRILEELYRRGTRTPSADQIQHITSQLRRYGKIEGKNVFYWFQNHKARERQKRRRQTAAESATDETKHSEATGREKGYEIQQTKTNCRWPPSKNCSTTPSEGPKSCIPSFLSGLAAAAAASASAAAATPWLKIFGECVKTQRMAKVGLEEGEGEGKRDSVEGDATWNTVNRQLLNPRRKTTTGRPGSSCDPTKTRHLNGFVEPYRDKANGVVEDDNGREESQTLQLFPLRSTKFCKYDKEGRQELEMSDSDMIKSSTFSPSSTFQFFEFLPLKN